MRQDIYGWLTTLSIIVLTISAWSNYRYARIAQAHYARLARVNESNIRDADDLGYWLVRVIRCSDDLVSEVIAGDPERINHQSVDTALEVSEARRKLADIMGDDTAYGMTYGEYKTLPRKTK